MQRVLITGANRGIGLALVRVFLEKPETQIFALCRTPQDAVDLRALAAEYSERLVILALDVTDDASIVAAAQAVAGQVDGLDVLINNAGINLPSEQQSLKGITSETMHRVFAVNTVGPLMVAQAFADLVRNGDHPRIINITSGLGSLTHKKSGGGYAYCASKAALNMVARALAGDLGLRGVVVVTLDPGWVKTDMGGTGAQLEPVESATGIMNVCDGLTADDNGKYFLYNGEEIPW